MVVVVPIASTTVRAAAIVPAAIGGMGIGAVAVGIGLHARSGRVGFEAVVGFAHIGQQVFAERFGLLHFFGVRAIDVQVHRLVALGARAVFEEARAAAFDLYAAPGFLLDVLDVGAAVADDLGAKVEAGQGFHVDGDAFLGPFTLEKVRLGQRRGMSYPSKLVSLELIWLASAESALIHEIGQFLLH